MATVSLSPAQQQLGHTPKQRVPLGVVSNAATNSPFRGVPFKRNRDQVEDQDQFPWNIQPQAKRHAFEKERLLKRASPKKQALQPADDRVFSKRSNTAQPTPLERQLLAARDEKQRQQQKVERQDRGSQQNIKGIKQWQEHYKRAFPMFVFYFEGIPEDVRMRCSKYARNLGAREEKFFSKDVTHVVTTREIPTEVEAQDAQDARTTSSHSTTTQNYFRSNSGNPSLLVTSVDQGQTGPQHKLFLDPTINKRFPSNGVRDVDSRKGPSGITDILLRAKEMGMKVWQLEKFQRMIRTMLEIPNETQAQVSQSNRSKQMPSTKGGREAELSRMLRNERLNGPSDRDSTMASTEMIQFKGPYIYIRDMDERHKPILVRDYQKPSKGDSGDWPQFHGVSAGRCPFVPEPAREEPEHPRMRETEREARRTTEPRSAPLTKAKAQENTGDGEAVADVLKRPPFRETKTYNAAVLPTQSPEKEVDQENFCPPPDKRYSLTQMNKSNSNSISSRFINGEPAASGMQPSNITSAIRSQMISSTAAAPGAKAGTSKEVHGLQRKVLQKNVGPAMTHQARGSTLGSAAVSRAERAIPVSRHARRQGQQPTIHEDQESTLSEDEDVWMAEGVRRAAKNQDDKKKVKGGGKPGYCENCKDKYDDFDEHIGSRKHRKFALTKENWKDLDKLLAHLGRPPKEVDSDSF